MGHFGDEGNDKFVVTGTNGDLDEMDVARELAIAETTGFSDFENNEDDLTFD